MNQDPQKKNWIAIVILSIAAGTILIATSTNAFIAAIKEDPGVLRFVSGLILLLCGILRLLQRKNDKAMIDLGIMIGQSRKNTLEAEQDAT